MVAGHVPQLLLLVEFARGSEESLVKNGSVSSHAWIVQFRYPHDPLKGVRLMHRRGDLDPKGPARR